MLFIQDQSGAYLPASKDAVFSEARRLASYQLRRGVSIHSSTDAWAAIGHRLKDYQYEMFACLFLDSQHRLLAFEEMFRGSVGCATIHPREVVREALRLNAAAVVLAHNHPSGCSEPSKQDIALTKTLAEILKVVDVRVLDHLVIGDEVVSFSDLGIMPE